MIGDVLTSSILFEALRLKYPKAQLDYLINEHTFLVVENNPFINNFIFFTKDLESSKNALFKFAKIIKHEKYDIVIDVYSKFSSNLITLLSGATTKISKHKWYTSFIYTNTYKEKKKPKTSAGLAIENRLKFLEPILNAKPEVIKPKIYLTSNEISNSKKLLTKFGIDLSKPLYMISVLGSSESKTYPPSYMSKLIDNIVLKTKGQILFNYIPKQKTDAKLVYNSCKPETQQNIYFDLFGKNLREFLSITKHCTALIGNEGGAINMAKALNISTFSIFSPWISKEAWCMFEDGKTHISIHLKDIKPNLYNGETMKKMKNNVSELYKIFSPDLIIPKLNKYLKNR